MRAIRSERSRYAAASPPGFARGRGTLAFRRSSATPTADSTAMVTSTPAEPSRTRQVGTSPTAAPRARARARLDEHDRRDLRARNPQGANREQRERRDGDGLRRQRGERGAPSASGGFGMNGDSEARPGRDRKGHWRRPLRWPTRRRRAAERQAGIMSASADLHAVNTSERRGDDERGEVSNQMVTRRGCARSRVRSGRLSLDERVAEQHQHARGADDRGDRVCRGRTRRRTPSRRNNSSAVPSKMASTDAMYVGFAAMMNATFWMVYKARRRTGDAIQCARRARSARGLAR